LLIPSEKDSSAPEDTVHAAENAQRQPIKDQIADPDYEGYCHCMLYYKSLEE